MKISIVSARKGKTDDEAVRSLYDALRKRGAEVQMNRDGRLKEVFPGLYRSENELTRQLCSCDVLIVFGGDGSITHAAASCAPYGSAVLGINRGRVGYLADADDVSEALIDDLLEGRYTVEERMMLETNAVGEKRIALNDVVLKGKNTAGIVEIEAFCSGKSMGIFRCDGVIVASPTGSTAYSLAAGGSVVDPTLDCLCLTPVCAHSLTARPMILSPDKTITLVNRDRRSNVLQAAADGGIFAELEPGEELGVRAGAVKARFVRMREGFFYDTLRKKLIDGIRN